jgi:signal transduction histidine kinase
LGWSNGVHFESIANFAHELRTPVQVLLGYLDILRGDRVDVAAATLAQLADRTIIERMNANVHELAQTVENVLAFVLADAAIETAAEEVKLAEFLVVS